MFCHRLNFVNVDRYPRRPGRLPHLRFELCGVLTSYVGARYIVRSSLECPLALPPNLPLGTVPHLRF